MEADLQAQVALQPSTELLVDLQDLLSASLASAVVQVLLRLV